MSESFLVVSIADRRRLVPIPELQELLPLMALSHVEGQGGACRGVANLRGDLVPVFDTAGPTAPLSASRYIVIVRGHRGRIGLIVDEVHDVISIPPDQLTSREVGAGREARMALIQGELLSVLNPSDAIEHAP